MGILRNREELLPVTCAVMSASDRDAFFEKIKKKSGGRLDSIAARAGTIKSVVGDWISGKSNVPYHSLQRLSREFEIEMPPVSELRRELQQVVEQIPEKRFFPGPEPEPAPRAETKPEPPPEPKAEKPPAPKPAPQKNSERAKAPAVPKFSEALAYWAGASFAGAKRVENTLVFSAGAGFAAIWAAKSRELFSLEAERPSDTDAVIACSGFEVFFDRLDLKSGHPAPGAPRWVWSNPLWKIFFLRGVIDGCGALNPDSNLAASGLSEPLLLSVKKLLTAAKVDFSIAPGGTLIIQGEAALKLYFESIGSENAALKAFTPTDTPQSSETPPKPAAPVNDANRRRRRRGRRGRGRGAQSSPPQTAVEGPLEDV